MEEVIKLAVIGSPISHSLSPKIHKMFAESLGIDISYEALQVEPVDFEESIRSLFQKGYTGLNVTLPLKQLASEFADNQSEESRICGSANTLWKQGSAIYADSTDGRGLINDFQKQNVELKDKDVILLGSGGSARAILPSLLKKNPKRISILNRSEDKALALADKFSQSQQRIQVRSISEKLNFKPDIVINSTSASTLKQDILLPDDIFYEEAFFYDLSYSKDRTSFIEMAISSGVRKCSDGIGMLIEQAALSFEIWTSVKPKTDSIKQSIFS